MSMDVYFVRHGETDYNKQSLIQGRINIPLNDHGRAQAAETAAYFREKGIVFDQVYASPLVRARETAAIVSGWREEQIETDERVQELAFGAAEGVDFHTLPEGVMNLFRNPAAYEVPEGGESIDALRARCGDFLGELAALHEKNPAIKTVLVVTHGAAMRGFLSCIEQTGRDQFWKKGLFNCCVVKAKLRKDGYGLESIENPLKTENSLKIENLSKKETKEDKKDD